MTYFHRRRNEIQNYIARFDRLFAVYGGIKNIRVEDFYILLPSFMPLHMRDMNRTPSIQWLGLTSKTHIKAVSE